MLHCVSKACRRHKHIITLFFSITAIVTYTTQGAFAANGYIAQFLSSPLLAIEGTTVKTDPLKVFYRGRGFSPVWVSASGVNAQAKAALEVLSRAQEDGLDPAYYGLNGIYKLETAKDDISRAKLDILISHALLNYAHNVRYGRDSAERRESFGITGIKPVSVEILDSIAKTTPNNVIPLMAALAPTTPEYMALKRELHRYRTLAAQGGLPKLTYYRLLQLHNNVPEVKILRQLLVASGDLAKDNQSEVFDEEVDLAVRRLQERHGLRPTGIVDSETRKALNIDPQSRIQPLIASMERLRWLPSDFGKKYVIVNLPGYSLRAVRPGAEDLTMKIIVGKVGRQTPTFIRSISQVIFNPTWTVPPRIAAEDILPDIKKEGAEFFTNSDFKLLKYNNNGGTYEVDPKSVNWGSVTKSNFNWTLFQPPGEFNPLGRVKFYIPNTPQVYMHDTPRKNLFSDLDRNLSSGCIRLELPKAFANYVLAGSNGWSTERVYKTFNTTKDPIHVAVRDQPKLYFVYLTATVDRNGQVHFHDDIYGRDAALLAGFERKSKLPARL